MSRRSSTPTLPSGVKKKNGLTNHCNPLSSRLASLFHSISSSEKSVQSFLVLTAASFFCRVPVVESLTSFWSALSALLWNATTAPPSWSASLARGSSAKSVPSSVTYTAGTKCPHNAQSRLTKVSATHTMISRIFMKGCTSYKKGFNQIFDVW